MPGTSELIIIFILVIFLFGPQRLPEIGRTLGKAVAEYKRAVKEFEGKETGFKLNSKHVHAEDLEMLKDSNSKFLKKIDG